MSTSITPGCDLAIPGSVSDRPRLPLYVLMAWSLLLCRPLEQSLVF